MTEEQIVADIVTREGGFIDHPADEGGPTKFGITAATLGNWWGLPRPATVDEVRALTVEQAKTIYRQRYIRQPGFTQENIPDERVRTFVIDTGVNSGPSTAMRHLQTAVRVSADGRWGPITHAAVLASDPEAVLKDLIRLRCLHYVRIVQGDTTQAVFLAGWISRALSFL